MRQWIRRHRRALTFLMCFGIFRTSVADWNPIPSGSMRPTLLEGDVVLVNRVAYDLKLPLSDGSVVALSDPQRGDIVTFTSPKDGMRLIKRIVGIPGDTLQMRDEVLWVNGVPAQYYGAHHQVEPMKSGATLPALGVTERSFSKKHAVQFLPSVAAMRSFGPVTVPANSYFMLGDNRDDSADSRYIGFVPRRSLIGHAHHILVSADILDDWMPRFRRFGHQLM